MSKLALNKVLRKFPDYVIDSHAQHGNDTVVIKKEALIKVVTFIKESRQLNMDMLVDITCVDYPEADERFMMVYHFYSTTEKHRLRIKAMVSEEDIYIDSLVPIWDSANWLEREVYDMFGVKFNNHPNMTRILMYESFKGHPLRKDYSITKRQPIPVELMNSTSGGLDE